MKTCTSQRDPGSTSPLWIASSDRDGNHAEPLGNQAVGGNLATGEEFGLDHRLAGDRSSVARGGRRGPPGGSPPRRNSILGPLFDLMFSWVMSPPVAISALAT